VYVYWFWVTAGTQRVSLTQYFERSKIGRSSSPLKGRGFRQIVWPTSMGITCINYNGQSVVDYLICSQSFTSRMLKFDIGDYPIEMKSDHAPLLDKLDFPANPHNNQILGIQKKNISKGKILMN
jgi:hypothetical protein